MTTLYVLGFISLFILLVVLAVVGVHQLVDPVILIMVLPFLIFIGGRRKMVKSRSK